MYTKYLCIKIRYNIFFNSSLCGRKLKHMTETLLNTVHIYKSREDSAWLPAKVDLEILVSADAEDWGSSDTVCLTAGQSESWTLTQDEEGSRFRYRQFK